MPTHTSVFNVVHRGALWVVAALLLAVAACAAPSTNHGDAPEDATPAAQSDPATSTATPIDNPPRPPQLPPVKRPSPQPSLGPGLGNDDSGRDNTQVNRSCSTDAECTVKNVGNCCGYYPGCVHVDSPTDPEGVQAQCAKSGMMSICGFPSITSCQCVAGECKGSSKALLE